MAVLEIERLSASYGGGDVIEDVSLRIPQGEVFGLVGPNGHGKTTLLRAISGLLPRQRGIVRFDGHAIDGLAAEKIALRGIVHVPQGDLVYKDMSVFENLLVGGYTNPLPGQTGSRLDLVYELFPKLKERSGQKANSLSGGERRMLGIGRGLMMAEAKLLMLDEPSLGLAPIIIEAIYEAIHRLRQMGLSILIVEENVNRIASVADHLSMMSHGHIVWSGDPGELSSRRELMETYLGV
ncbi:ABC transporter ATP-binding protein [Mesorhizobium sp. M3A.F.Ca.ET.080.04.2.1]|uniref:ABC transporter ATP-binding protein n=1 Tax=Mesorhizobium sp. M3A.F.Ca.ET.080.04.2.1 TaxID=2493676 RepID=UPI000F752FC0|nr:ABC transporter ATP-binding protein [Mesorhizobium sp. M3A.F.Ca.ET.080.04.2.1]AZO07971.1 ABC transporter ATP-binding protein [Mesorhizobium sp. M3A.F.Ca.ET.080.04.2.1]RWF18784.1 MAG: ABC transporter ATP-binding protein [Mesorhizobium sp.]